MYKCRVYQENIKTITENGEECRDEITLHECICATLKEIASELGLTYQQVADISSKARKRKDFTKFKYYPKIEIVKIKKVSV